MTVVPRIVEADEILIQTVTHEDIDPPVVVNVATGYRYRRLHIDIVPERCIRDLLEAFPIHVSQQPVLDGVCQCFVTQCRTIVEFITDQPVSGHVKVLIAIVVEIASRHRSAVRQR